MDQACSGTAHTGSAPPCALRGDSHKSDKRYIRRDERERINENEDVGRSRSREPALPGDKADRGRPARP